MVNTVQGNRARHRAIAVAMALSVPAWLLVGCGSDGAAPANRSTTTEGSAPPTPDLAPLPEAVQELDIDATEYAFEISPDPAGGVKPGWTLLRFHNTGAEAHQVMFARIKDGVDLAELAAAGAGDSSGSKAIEFVDMVGGVSYIGAGQDTTAMVNLQPGTVMAMCYVPDAKGVAHALHGMTAMLTVSEDTAAGPATPSDTEVVGSIELGSDGYRIPDTIRAGWYHVRNTDTALHELALMQLGEPVDDDEAARLVDDLAANKTPGIDLTAVGGAGAISPGFDGYLYLDLEPGPYLAVDFMPDPGQPRPHMLDGYFATFTV